MSRQLYEDNKTVSQIIRQGVTSLSDLLKLEKRLGIDVKFGWVDQYDHRAKYQLLNIDADHMGGTHWVAVYDNTYYFDPLGLPPPRDWMDYLEWTEIPIQDYRHGGCGLYAMLFLFYASRGEIDKFYNVFC